MKTQIRDITVIEKELKDSYLGMISFIEEEDSITQLPVTFIYYDKNIYFFVKKEDDALHHIPFGTVAKFAIFKSLRNKSDNTLYKLLTIFLSGKIKPVDEVKQIEELIKGFNKKYKVTDDETLKIFMIDTTEFLAFEYSGG